jgi:carbon monoxide dehydrogenase subunit G
MPSFSTSTLINAPITEVFAVFTDLEKTPERIPEIKKSEKLTPGPVGLGTKFKETRIIFKREASETFEFTAFEPNHSYEIVARSCGAEYRTQFKFTPEGAGTRVDVTFAIRAKSLFGKLFTPMAYLLMGPMKKWIAKDIAGLRRVLETNPTPA